MLGLDAKNEAAAGLFALLIILTLVEMYFSYHEDRKYYEKRDTWTNIYLTSITFFINLAVKGATFFVLSYFYQFRLFQIKNVIIYWFILVAAQDFLYWVLHYVGHYSRMFWAMHVTHHSSEHFNLTTGFRSTVFEPFYRVIFYLPLALMGFTAMDILYAYLLTQLYGNLVHTQAEINFPRWYSYLFVTPAHHRIHHASNVPYLDKNMGMLFIIWDRMFGTFQEDLPEPIKYGLTTQPDDLGVQNIIFHEWKALITDIKRAPTLSSKIKYLVMPPGWSHDGSTQVAKVMQAEYYAELERTSKSGFHVLKEVSA